MGGFGFGKHGCRRPLDEGVIARAMPRRKLNSSLGFLAVTEMVQTNWDGGCTICASGVWRRNFARRKIEQDAASMRKKTGHFACF
jgi:hypothetical protein